MADIFISYARPDRDRIEAISNRLEAAGYTVWWDRQIIGGEDFYQAIERELEAAKVVLVAWSEHSAQSRWVKDEASVAAESGKIVSLHLDGGEPPLGFKQYHSLDFSGRLNASMPGLIEAVDLKLGGNPGNSSRPLVKRQSQTRKRSWLIPGLLVSVFAAGGLALWPKGQAPEPPQTVQTTSAPEKSIAVLAFADLSDTGDQEYFADGVSEEILNALVRVPDLQVAGRTSSFFYKGKDMDIRTIGSDLDVAHVLEGSVRKQDDRLRITAQLIRAEDGYHLWSKTFDGSVDDIFEFQETISETIAAELEVILADQTRSRLNVSATQNSQAYDLFLKGRDLSLSSFRADDLISARDYLRQAVSMDPDFSVAWAELARVNGQIWAFTNQEGREDVLANVARAAEKALTANPDQALAHIAKFRDARYRQNLADATRHIKHALELEPDNAEVNSVAGDHFAYMGRTEAAIELIENAQRSDPLRTDPWVFRSILHMNKGEYEPAVVAANRATELGNFAGLGVVGDALYALGKKEEAQQTILDLRDIAAAQLDPGMRDPRLWGAGSRAYYGDSELDKQALRGFLSQALRSDPDMAINAFHLGMMARVGMYEELFQYWNKAGAGNATLGAQLWSDFDWAREIRAHPGFAVFVQTQGYIEDWNAHGWPDICRPLDERSFECD